MCEFCEGEESRFFIDGASGDWYLEVKTDEWDEVENDWVYVRAWIDRCPICGRRLGGERDERKKL